MKQRIRKGVLVNWWRPNVERANPLRLSQPPANVYAWHVFPTFLRAIEFKLKLQRRGRTGIEVFDGFGSKLPDRPKPTDDRVACCGDLVTTPFRGELQF